MSFKPARRSKSKSAVRPVYGRKKNPLSLSPVSRPAGPREAVARRHAGVRRAAQPRTVELLPLVTVVFPIRNEIKFIERSLGAILAQDYPADRMEIIVADGMSTDGTRSRLAEMQTRHANLRIVDNPKKIASSGLNAAIRAARGEYIVRVDGHTIIESDYVRRCIEKLRATGADNVGGKMSAVGTNLFGKIVALATSSRFGVGGAQFHYCDEETWVDTVYLGAWRRDLFARIGLFDDRQPWCNEDDEFNYRLQENGGRVLLSPGIKSRYYNRNTIRSLSWQYFRYGFWKVRVMQKHPRQMRMRQFAPPALVGSLLATSALALFTSFGIYLLAGLLGLYLTANFAAATSTARKSSWKHLPGLMLAFGLLHVGYGAGFLLGLVKFGNYWRDQEEQEYLCLDQADLSGPQGRASRFARAAAAVEPAPVLAAVS